MIALRANILFRIYTHVHHHHIRSTLICAVYNATIENGFSSCLGQLQRGRHAKKRRWDSGELGIREIVQGVHQGQLASKRDAPRAPGEFPRPSRLPILKLVLSVAQLSYQYKTREMACMAMHRPSPKENPAALPISRPRRGRVAFLCSLERGASFVSECSDVELAGRDLWSPNCEPRPQYKNALPQEELAYGCALFAPPARHFLYFH